MRESRDSRRYKREMERRYADEDRDYRRPRRKKKNSSLPVILATAVVAVIALVLLGNGLMEEFGSSKERQDLATYYGTDPGDGAILIIDGEVKDETALVTDGGYFLPISVANGLFDNFYYDSTEGHLLVTTSGGTTEGTAGSDYVVSGEEIYISQGFLGRFFPMVSETYDDPKRIDIITAPAAAAEAAVLEDTKLRTGADKKSPILLDLKKGDKAEVVEAGEDWTEVRIRAVKGFVEKEALGESTPSQIVMPQVTADDGYVKHLRDHSIVLGFHNVAVADANSFLEEAMAQTKGMNVVAPTWLSMSGDMGEVTDIGSTSYVQTAHEKGCEVWVVADNFNGESDSDAVLASTSKRLALERNLVDHVTALGADGLNIDFEQLKGETGDDFAQFLREISILTRQAGLVLSVDNYVPQDYTGFYRRDIQAKVADYIIIMGYDEHTSASSEAGSVASLGFVTKGIEDTLQEVPAAQVINAIPFYTRKWAFEAGTLSCETMGMADAAAFLRDNGVTPTWDAEACQNAATFDKDGVTYSIWLEDAESISSKLAVMKNHELAGVACWKLTQETPDIWDMISSYYGD